MVYYRKYRPQTIGELDSTKVRETLSAVLKGGSAVTSSVPHAFLFTGPKGLGKTSAARIVAKVVNCETSENKRDDKFEPCNKCEQCISITNGTNLDVLEIDGASNRGIDEIRSLREKVNLAPANPLTKRKVYIIDEVHMLTTEAFNALLKTIEEPPLHVIFIFCTTEPHKVPETILSRCFHVSFSLATQDEIVHSLQRIAIGEKIDVDLDALKTIASLANGGFRDASKILEELVSVTAGEKITAKVVEEKYQVSNTLDFVINLFQYLHQKNTKSALATVQQAVQQGVDMKYFLQVILETLHELILNKLNIVTDNKFQMNKAEFSLENIKILVELFSQAYSQVKYSPISQLPLEIAVISWEQKTRPVILEEDESRPIGPQNGKNTVENMRKKHEAIRIKKILSGKDEAKKESKSKTDDPATPKQGDFHKPSDELTNLLENLIYKVKPYNHSIAGVLRGSKIDSFSDVSITFVTPYKFHKERLEDRRSCEIIEKALKEITGKNLKVLVELKSAK